MVLQVAPLPSVEFRPRTGVKSGGLIAKHFYDASENVFALPTTALWEQTILKKDWSAVFRQLI